MTSQSGNLFERSLGERMRGWRRSAFACLLRCGLQHEALVPIDVGLLSCPNGPHEQLARGRALWLSSQEATFCCRLRREMDARVLEKKVDLFKLSRALSE